MADAGKERTERFLVREAGHRILAYLRHMATLDERSLALFRILVGLVVLYDIWLAWSTLDLWPGLQGFVDGLPFPFLLFGSESWSLGVLLFLYAVVALGLLCGYRTRWCTLGTWILSAGYQYAARYTADYHHEILCTLLFWCQFIDLGRRWSIDAWRRGRATAPSRRPLLECIGACFFTFTFAHIYLDNIVNKYGPAWRQDGTAVWFALKDLGLSSELGLWAVNHLPFELFWALTYAVVGIETVAPLLIVSPWWRARTRVIGCFLLITLHSGLWVFMDLDAFPLTMIAGACGLLPCVFWAWVHNRRQGAAGSQATATRKVPDSPVAPSAAAKMCSVLRWMLLVTGVAINLEGSRLLTFEEYPYRGGRWIERAKSFLGLETEWWMYAAEPPDFGGWWVVVARTADGREIDPITWAAPTLAQPDSKAELYFTKGESYWFETPVVGDSPARRYANFLAWHDRRINPPARQITHMVFLYLYQSYLPLQNEAHPPVPVLTYRWPEEGTDPRPPLLPTSILRRVQAYALDADALWLGAWTPDKRVEITSY